MVKKMLVNAHQRLQASPLNPFGSIFFPSTMKLQRALEIQNYLEEKPFIFKIPIISFPQSSLFY